LPCYCIKSVFMKIGIMIGRIGGVDGVALETEKWIEVLKRMGHEVFLISGQFQSWDTDPEHDTLVHEMSFFSPESFWGQKKASIEDGDLKPKSHEKKLLQRANLFCKF